MSTVQDFSQNKILGQGGYGNVYEGVWSGKPVAIKPKFNLSSLNIASNIKREEEAWQKLDHPNVIKLFHVETNANFRYFYLELCQASLDKLFLNDEDPDKYKGPIPPPEEVLLQLALGLEYIHDMGLLHRDIKPANVRIWVNPEKEEVLMKWADFGLSKLVNRRRSTERGFDFQTHAKFDWSAPELTALLFNIKTEVKREIKDTIQMDVYAAGLVFGYYLTGGIHLYGSRYQMIANILMKKPINLNKIQPQNARDLILKMLADQPEQRITSSDVVKELNRIYPTNSYKFEVKTTKLNHPQEQATIDPSSGILVNLVQASTTAPIITEIKFDNKEILGFGGYGYVFKGEWKNHQVAVKKMKLSKVVGYKQEELALPRLDHPNIIKLLHVESDADFKYFALELCQASLDTLFLKDGNPKKYLGPMPSTIDVLLQLSMGLEYVHEQKLVHRDIKPQNVLIWVNPENGKVLMKWADFGLSKLVNERGTCSMSGVRGTLDWLAPELLKLIDDGEANKGEKEAKQRGTIQTDVFAEGLVFGYYLTGGLHPFGSRFQIVPNILENNPVNLSKIQPQYARDLIQKMLADQPEQRIKSSVVTQELEQQAELQNKLIGLCMGKTYPSVDSIKNLIKNGVDINCVDKDGSTPLLCLIQKKVDDDDKSSVLNADLIDIIRLLIKNGIDVNSMDRDGSNTLHLLSRNYKKENLIDIIRLLLENGIDVNCKDKNGDNALNFYCKNHKNEKFIPIIELLIAYKIDVNSKDRDGDNALHYLCVNYDNENLIDIIRLLIKNGIDVNSKDRDGWNYLHLLCEHYNKKNLIDIIRLLIENKIDVNCKNRDRQNAIAIVQQSRRENRNEIVELLSNQHTTDVAEEKDNDGWNALLLLCQKYPNKNLIDIIRPLIENGMDMNEKDDNGKNAFHFLCSNDKNENTIEIIRYFIEHGFDINQKYENDKNALHLLAKYYKKRDIIDIVKVFIHSGINIHHKDVHNENALHEVVKSSMDQYLKSEMIRLLIRYGIQVYPDSESQSNKYKELFTEKDFEGKKCLDYLVEEEIRLGWHEDCKSCEEILSIQEISRSRLQHHQMFVNIYSVFNLILEDLENWKQSNQKSGEAEIDVKNPGQWFRNKAEQYDKGDRKKCFLVMAEISEQVKDGFDSSCFNCDNYEIYLRYMHRITEIANLKEQKEEMEWFYLLPFNFPRPHDPIDPSESEEVKTKRENKRKWEETLLNWAHKEKEAHHGEILKKCAEEDDCLPAKLQHLCHGQKK